MPIIPRTRRAPAVALVWGVLLALSVALSACGNEGGEDDEAEVRRAIELATTSTDLSLCNRLYTQRFANQTRFGPGREAIVRCEPEQKRAENAADSVDVSDVQVDGHSATAKATFKGSNLNGATVEMALIEDKDQWKLDRVISITDFDRDSFLRRFRNDLTSPPDLLSDQEAACLIAGLREISNAVFKRLLLGTAPARLSPILRSCGLK